jgi:hypothetical protein
MVKYTRIYLLPEGTEPMRLRWISVLAALLMLAPAAGFARTSTPMHQDQQTETTKKPKKMKKAKTKKPKKEKKTTSPGSGL